MEIWELILLLLVAFQAHCVIDHHSPVSGTDSSSYTALLEADHFLTSYGYYPSSDRRPGQERNPSLERHSERTKALKLFQKFYNLPQSGKLDEETTQLMQSPRCGNPDITPNVDTLATPPGLQMDEEEDVNQTRKENATNDREESGVNAERGRLDTSRKTRVKRDKENRGTHPLHKGKLGKWSGKELRWFFYNQESPQYQRERSSLHDAFSTWEKVVPIKFVEVDYKNLKSANLGVKFHSFHNIDWNDIYHEHNDWREVFGTKKEHPKKGPRSKDYSIAHAGLQPSVGKDFLFRDLHFDMDYNWWGNNELYTVALHEIGHVLGLEHNFDKKSVMYPYNQGASKFSSTDLRAVEELYGLSKELLCNTTIIEVDDILKASYHPYNQTYFIISGDRVQITSEAGTIASDYCFKALFPNAPSEYDVMFSVNDTVIFIKGNTLLQHNVADEGFKNISFPKDRLHRDTPQFAVSHNYKGRHYTRFYGKKWTWYFEFDGDNVWKTQYHGMVKEVTDAISVAKFAVQWKNLTYFILPNNRYVKVRFSNHHPGLDIATPFMNGVPSWMRDLLCKEISESGAKQYGSFLNNGQTTTQYGPSRASLMLSIIPLSLIKLF